MLCISLPLLKPIFFSFVEYVCKMVGIAYALFTVCISSISCWMVLGHPLMSLTVVFSVSLLACRFVLPQNVHNLRHTEQRVRACVCPCTVYVYRTCTCVHFVMTVCVLCFFYRVSVCSESKSRPSGGKFR